jgi:hypothetical protein
LSTSGVVANCRDEIAMCTNCTDVLRDVSGAAEGVSTFSNPNDWDRRFGRNAFDVAAKVHVEHGIADDGHAAIGGSAKQRGQAVARE